MKQSMVLVLLAAGLCVAGVIRVPSEQPTIQAGLNAAGANDTVLVAPGAYTERLIWPTQDGITLLSEDGAAATMIDAEGLGRVVSMDAIPYTSATVMQGFTIAKGRQSGSAAGIKCQGSPVFLHNHIVDNVSQQHDRGGGIYADGSPTFAFNVIARDSLQVVDQPGFRYGGGIYCTGGGVFYQNVFEDNAVFDSSCSGFRYGGGLYVHGGSTIVFCNLFLDNAARMIDGSGYSHGGAVCVGSGASAYIANNTFVGNVCAAHITYGGAVYAPCGNTVIKNNIVVRNSCLGSGRGGGLASDSIAMVFDHNDVWQNSPDNYYGCAAGPSALSADPLFAVAPFGDYCLSQTAAGQPDDSPCLDAGDSLLGTSPVDLDSLIHTWTTRTDSVPDMRLIDIGYHYSPAPLTGLATENLVRPARPTLRVAPNPASGTHVRLSGRLGTDARVFDACGRLVALRKLHAGSDDAKLDVRGLTSGIYVVQTESPAGTARCRLLVQR
jgi:hypothetical protein